jgi:uncharacterized repeat protein (TIGR01451 family)
MKSLLLMLVGLGVGAWEPALLPAGTYTTYAAWSDVAAKNRGHMYIYTGNYPSTDVSLYYATTPNTGMNTLYCGFPILGVGPYQPVFEVGSCPVPPTGGFGNNYFKCQSTNPIIWEVEEDITGTEQDSHDFLAAADTTNYRGSVFMTYMRDDSSAGTDYGDQAAVFNAGATPMTVTVRKWTGTPPAGSWGPVLITSPPIPPLGVWMWSPSAPPTHDRGGTDGAAQGHYRFDCTGTGMLYKGNTFGPYTPPGNRDNLIHMGPDINDGTKLGDDLLGVVVTNGGAPHIVINNQGNATATFEILKFNPNTPGFDTGTERLWPVDGDDPTGTWTVVGSGSVPVNQSYSYNAGGLYNAGFYRVRSTNGQPLSAAFGSAILQQTWCDGDYLYASDTRRAFGRRFSFGARFFNPAAPSDPVQVQVICPLPNTTVNMVVDGGISGPGFLNITKTNTPADAGLDFSFARPSANNEDWHFTITADKIIYVYVMSSTSVSSTAPGETFFSVPPPIDPILIVTKSVSRAVASLGDTLSYTLVAENPGSGNVTNAQIWDTLPPGVAFVSSTPPYSSVLGSLYTWNLGTLGSQASVTVSITVAVTAGTQLEVKHNIATAKSDLTQAFESNDAPFTILIPGAELTKSVSKTQAMPGETLTYVLSYTNTSPPLPGTPKLNLRVKDGTRDNNTISNYFEVTNYSGSSIQITDLQICLWVYDDETPSSPVFNNYYGGGTSPWVWGGPALVGAVSAWSPPQTLPSNRKANLKLCFSPSTPQVLANNQVWQDINIAFTLSYPKIWDSALDDYSQNPGSASYVNDHHFALYYQGKLVSEYTDPSTPDPETGLEPKYLWLEDFVPANLNYLGSAPAATLTGNQLTWSVDAVPPASTKSFTWWGQIPGGTPGGTIIPNVADGSTVSGPVISNRVETLVGSASLSTVKSVNKGVFTFGETVTYCIAWNLTGTAGINVVITDPFDPILTFIGADHGGVFTPPNTVTWNLGPQPPNSSGTVCFWAQISAYPSLPWEPGAMLAALPLEGDTVGYGWVCPLGPLRAEP